MKLLFFSLFLSFSSFSQNSVNASTMTISELVENSHGKYQIQMLGIRTKPAIEQELLIEILDKQLDSERVYFQYKENIRIMILSKDEILNGQIISDEEFIVYLN